MRVLHTADWHLGSRLGPYDRTDELFQQVEMICRLAMQHRVDVLLVAGDVFERRTNLPELTKRLVDILAPCVRQGMHVILVPGNHDDRAHFRMMRALLGLELGHSERVHVVQTRDLFTINGVQFAVIPYPSPEMLAPYQVNLVGATQRHAALSNAYADLVRVMVGGLDPRRPAVFVGHITVAGVTTPSERELTYDADLHLGTADLPLASNLAYIALGHIHQAQQIRHPVPCYYSGSIERLNMGERNDDKCVLLVDVPSSGPATVTPLPLDATPFRDLRLPAGEVETVSTAYPDLDRAIVRVCIECQRGDDVVRLQRRVRELCPRCLDVQFAGDGLLPVPAGLPAQPKDYATTALDYLRQAYAAAADLPHLEQRANELLREVNDVTTTH